jgi:hypothetical protein
VDDAAQNSTVVHAMSALATARQVRLNPSPGFVIQPVKPARSRLSSRSLGSEQQRYAN